MIDFNPKLNPPVLVAAPPTPLLAAAALRWAVAAPTGKSAVGVAVTTASPSRPATPTPTDGRHQVLLVTMGRSGSSFTSAIVQKPDDVFYFFEPLASLASLIDKKKENDNMLM